jgi:L-lactate dehydrogenase complex protein LldG
MKDKREQFLSRVKGKLPQAFLPEARSDHPGSFQGYSYPQMNLSPEGLVERFTQELQALSGHVYPLADIEQVIPTLLTILSQHQANQLIAWDDVSLGIPWLRRGLIESGITIASSELSPEDEARKIRLAEMDPIVIGLTGAQGGLADTGSIALMSGPGRGRLASLLPPVHIALLPQSRLYPSLPAFLAAHPTVTEIGSNLVFITGPSRTGDIEMTLTMGVHGPGEVHVIITPQ